MEDNRRNPEKLLERIEAENKSDQSKLKIYLGAAPGVGKTYSMLQDAVLKRQQGLDVVVGIVETHGRKEIEELLKNLEVLPRLQVDYRGQVLTEFDLDAALKRRPALILMDEMAHTNVPNLRHTKRWQDIKELLDRGIDVYTTLNVQHIESLNDVVGQIIHARIQETVPDSMLELADTIELIDLPPEDLLKRLREGKVYMPKQAELASENFFRKGNLIALRELALRVTAERVSAQVLLYRQGQGIQHIWPTKEKILVCVGVSSGSIKLIRAAKRFATKLQAPWIAVHVDAPRMRLTEGQRHEAIQHLNLAAQLGAETRILPGSDIVKEVIRFAREENVTLIMIWRHLHSKLREFIRGSLAEELARHSEEIDVYVVTGEDDDTHEHPKVKKTKESIPWTIYGISFGLVVLATLANYIFLPYVKTNNMIMVYVLSVVIVALFGRVGPSILASFLSVFAYNFFFVPPLYAFAPSDVQNIFTLGVMLIVTIVISQLIILTRRQANSARRVERYTYALQNLTRVLATTRGVDKLLVSAVQYLGELFNCDVMALLPDKDKMVVRAFYPTEHALNEKEQSVMRWVYDLGQAAGKGTNTLPFSEALYVPLLASSGPIGVLRLFHKEKTAIFTPEQMRLLESAANQIALAIEVDRYQEQIVDNFLQMTYLEGEKIQLQKEKQSLNELISSVVKLCNKKIGRRPINIIIPLDLPDIYFDKTLIQDVLINLIDNANAFTPPDSPINIAVIKEPDHITVCVEDRGPGIVPDDINKLFDKFYRGQMVATERGQGLGLAICRLIIKAHGGEIWAENRVGGGAAFCFTLPY